MLHTSHKEFPMSGNKKPDDGFKKSSLSGVWAPIACVEVKLGDTVTIRDSKDPAGKTLTFNKDEWVAFIGGVKQGEFDV